MYEGERDDDEGCASVALDVAIHEERVLVADRFVRNIGIALLRRLEKFV